MANPNQVSNESKSTYICNFGITQPHPDLGDGTKFVDSRCIHLRPGSTVQLTEREAAHLIKLGAIRKAA